MPETTPTNWLQSQLTTSPGAYQFNPQSNPVSGYVDPMAQLNKLFLGAGTGTGKVVQEQPSILDRILGKTSGIFNGGVGGLLGKIGIGTKEGQVSGKDLGELLSGFGGLYGAYQGGQALDQAKDQFDFQKGIANTNLANQAQTINTQLADRQRARIASTGNNNANNTYESLNSYLKNNQVSGKI